MKHHFETIFEFFLICLVLLLIIANIERRNTIQELKRDIIHWQEKYGRLDAKIRGIESFQSKPIDDLHALQEQLDACRQEKLDTFLHQKNSLEDPF